MSVIKCMECGETYTSYDTLSFREWYESRGEFWGAPCSERMVEYSCPQCGSDDLDFEYVEPDDDDEEEEEDEA